MHPRDHALVSVVVIVVYSVVMGANPSEFVIWMTAGTLAGVFIDLDHLVLVYIFGRREVVKDWVWKPFRALKDSESLLEDMEQDYIELYYHRIISHVSIILVSLYLSRIFRLMEPLTVALVVHLVSDILWDIKENNYDWKVVNNFR
ncbi:MAG: hypothetical protein MUP63_02230 [Candidatus Nanohaloarchaeota archaeon QJJ-7]|nr:hypothetical protein [Candidatus Nanohaloarchaeota archaeon QJJ-7]